MSAREERETHEFLIVRHSFPFSSYYLLNIVMIDSSILGHTLLQSVFLIKEVGTSGTSWHIGITFSFLFLSRLLLDWFLVFLGTRILHKDKR